MGQRLIILISGILAVTIFDMVGALMSRKTQLNINLLSIISLMIYIAIGFWGGLWFDKITGITMTVLIGLYDAVIGWKIFVSQKADFGEYREILEEDIMRKELRPSIVISLILASALIGWFEAYLSGIFTF